MAETWGENLGAQFGIGLISFALMFVIGVPLLIISALVPTAAPVTVPLLVATVILLALGAATAKSVLMVGLYNYAVGDEAPSAFDQEQLRGAFTQR